MRLEGHRSQTVMTSRQEMLRLTLATLALLIAGLLATPAMESQSTPSKHKMAQREDAIERKFEKPLNLKGKSLKKRTAGRSQAERSVAQMTWRR